MFDTNLGWQRFNDGLSLRRHAKCQEKIHCHFAAGLITVIRVFCQSTIHRLLHGRVHTRDRWRRFIDLHVKHRHRGIRFKGHPVRTVTQPVTREGVNDLLEKYGFTGELDLLSIDIDGMDYWVWEAVTACSPRVVAVEYNWLFGSARAVTIPYSSDFDLSTIGNRAYRGASLAALAHLGRAKGYRLVATERVNAFFVRTDLAPDIREIDVARGYRAPLNIRRGKDVYQKLVRTGLPLVDVISGKSGTIAELAPRL